MWSSRVAPPSRRQAASGELPPAMIPTHCTRPDGVAEVAGALAKRGLAARVPVDRRDLAGKQHGKLPRLRRPRANQRHRSLLQ